MNELIKRLELAFSKNKIPDPYKIELWPTQLCNLNCRYCRAEDYSPKQKEISDKRILDLIGEAASFGVKEFIIAGGGEPLVRKDIVMKAMKKIKDDGIKGSMTTNGTLFNKDDTKNIVELGWDNIFFSIDGPNPGYNDALRKRGSFRKAVKNLKLINYFKKKFSTNKPNLGISMVLTRTNYKTLLNMFKLSKKLGISCLIVNPIKGNNTEYNEQLKLTNKDISDLRRQLPKIKGFAEKNKIQHTLKTLETDLVEKSSSKKKLENSYFNCFEPFTSVLINSFGGVGPCCERPDDFNQDSIIGKSLKEIWNGEYFNQTRNRKNKSEKCFYCNAWKMTDTEQIKMLLEQNE